jgi:hypothetical protein
VEFEMKLSGMVAAAALAVLWVSGPAAAQTREENCDAFVFGGETREQSFGYFNTCAAATMSRQNTIYVPQVVQRALANSFGFGPTTVEPTGLSALIAGDAEAPQDVLITPTADAAPAAAATPKWNAWVDGRYLYSDYTEDAGDLDGSTVTGMAGVDFKLGSKVSLGVIVLGEGAEMDSPLTDLSSTTYGIGPYLGIVLTDNIVFSANLMASGIESDQAGGFLNFETDRLQASAALSGYWYKGTWRFTPALTFAWSKDEEQETDGLFPDRTIETAVLTPSLQIGNTLRVNDKVTVEPWAGAALDFTLLSEVETAGFGSTNETLTDLRLQGGLNFGFGSSAQLAVTGEASGILDDEVDSYSIAGNLAVQF